MKFIHKVNDYYRASKIDMSLNESLSEEELNQQKAVVDSVLSSMTNGLNLIPSDTKSVTDNGVIAMELTIMDDGTDTEISLEELANIIETAIDAAVVADEIESDNEIENNHTIVVEVVPDKDEFDTDAFIEDELSKEEHTLEEEKPLTISGMDFQDTQMM